MFVQCQPTQTPEAIDLPELRAKYKSETAKRVRAEGTQQYVEAVDEFYESDPYASSTSLPPISSDTDVAIS
jgi:cyclohexanone monooxygenase